MQYATLIINFIIALPKLWDMFKQIYKTLKEKEAEKALDQYEKAEGKDEQKKSFDDLVDKL